MSGIEWLECRMGRRVHVDRAICPYAIELQWVRQPDRRRRGERVAAKAAWTCCNRVWRMTPQLRGRRSNMTICLEVHEHGVKL